MEGIARIARYYLQSPRSPQDQWSRHSTAVCAAFCMAGHAVHLYCTAGCKCLQVSDPILPVTLSHTRSHPIFYISLSLSLLSPFDIHICASTDFLFVPPVYWTKSPAQRIRNTDIHILKQSKPLWIRICTLSKHRIIFQMCYQLQLFALHIFGVLKVANIAPPANQTLRSIPVSSVVTVGEFLLWIGANNLVKNSGLGLDLNKKCRNCPKFRIS